MRPQMNDSIFNALWPLFLGCGHKHILAASIFQIIKENAFIEKRPHGHKWPQRDFVAGRPQGHAPYIRRRLVVWPKVRRAATAGF